jgi:hypothetical protein
VAQSVERLLGKEQVEGSIPSRGFPLKFIPFGCGQRLPGHPEDKVEDWPVPGGMGKTDAERERIRDDIRGRVEALVARLSKADST